MGGCKSSKGDSRLINRIEREIGLPKFNSNFIAPVDEGYIKYTDLINGGLTLFDIEIMNNAIPYCKQLQNIVAKYQAEQESNGSKTR